MSLISLADFFSEFTSASWRAGCLIAVLATLRLVVRGRIPAGVWFGAWIIVALRLIVPFSVPVSWSPYNLARPQLAPAAIDLPAVRAVPVVSVAVNNTEGVVDGIATRPVAESTGVSTGMSPPVSWTGRARLGLVWLLGAGVLLMIRATAGWRFRRGLRGAERADERVRAIAAHEARRWGFAQVLRCVETDAVDAPALFGVWRPALLFPRGFAAQLSDDELRLVVRHELAHWRRRDLPAQTLLQIAVALHWFNPLAWLAARLARVDCELACDEYVLRRESASGAQAYGETLLKVLGVIRGRRRPGVVVAMLEGKHQLTHRVRMIAEYRGSTAGRVWGGVLLLAVLGAASLTRESQAQVAPAQAVAAPLASSPASSTPASAPGPGDLKAAARPEAQDSATEYLQAVATDQRRKVDEIARRLQDFKEAHNLGSLDQRKDLIRESLKSANLEVQRAGVVLQMAETRVEQINDYRQRGTDLTGLSFIASQPLVAELRQQASQQRIAIAKLRETFRQSHPNMISATNALDQTQRELERAVNEICAQVEGERQAAFTASQRRTAELDRLKAASLELDRVAMQYLQIEREFLAQNQILQAILVRAGERESGVVLASRASAAPAAAEPVAAKAPVTAEPLSVVFQRKPSGWVLTETRGDQGELAKSADQIQVLKATLEASPPRTSGPSPAAPASDEFTVSVLGAVNAQGAVTLRETPRPLVLDALARAGGFAPNADRAAVRLIRLAEDGSRSTSILAEDALMSGNSFVQRGDVVIVPELVAPVPLFATVMGAVNKPGRIELPPGRKLTIVDLIASAGGPTRLGDLRKVRLTRLDQKTNGGMTMIIDVDSLIRSGQIRGEDVVIDAGDKIFVAERIL